MADRYWVGGSGNWSNTSFWSASSGGTSGASVPTSADNVYFDAGSDAGGIFTVTLDVVGSCADFNANLASPLDFTMTFAGSQRLDIYGSLTLPTTNFTWTKTSRLDFLATTSGKTITLNGVSLSTLNDVRFNGVGGEWTFGSNATLNSSGTCRLFAGTVNTNNFNFATATLALGDTTTSSTLSSTLNLGSSSVTCTTFSFSIAGLTYHTLNTGTSTITTSSSNNILGGRTYYDFIISGATSSGTIAGNNTFNNFTVVAPTVSRTINISFGGNQTINGTLSINSGATDPSRRCGIFSDTIGTPRTITAASVSLTNVDFRDIIAAGSASRPWTGTSLGDCKGNTDITFPAAKTVYWNLAGTQNWSSAGWATTNNGTPSIDNFPLPQDTAIFTQAGSAGTITVDYAYQIGHLNMSDGVSNRTSAFTLNISVTGTTFYGNITLFSSLTLSGGATVTIAGRTTQTVNFAGVSYGGGVVINSPGGTVLLGSSLTLSGSSSILQFISGTFDTSSSGYNVSITGSSGYVTIPTTSNNATCKLNGSTVTVGGFLPWIDSSTGGFTLDAGTSTIILTNSGPQFIGGSKTFYNLTTNNAALSSFSMIGSNTFNNVTFGARTSAGITNIQLPSNATTTINGTLSVNSGAASLERRMKITAADSPGTSFFGTPSSQTTIIAAAVSLTNCDFQGVIASGAAAPFSGTSIGNASNNSNITFTTAKTVYWSSASGASANWNSASWATSSGGTGSLANFPLPQDTVIIDAAGATTGDGLRTNNTITFNANYFIGTLDTSNRTTAWNFSWSSLTANIVGDLKLDANVTLSGTGAVIFSNVNSTQNVTSNGRSFPSTAVATWSSTLKLLDNLTITGTTSNFSISSGNFDLNNKTLSVGTFTSTTTNTRSITFNGGTISLTGSGASTWNFSGSGFTSSAGTGIGNITLTSSSLKTFAGGGYTYAATLNQGGAGTLTITGDNTFAGLTNTVQPATITVTAGSTQSFTGAVTLAGTSGNLLTLNSSIPGTRYTFKYSGTPVVSNLSFCSITDCIGYENAFWRALQTNGCVNGGNNLGWIFTPTAYSAGALNL